MSKDEACTSNFKCRNFWPLLLVALAFYLLAGGVVMEYFSAPIVILWLGWGGLLLLSGLPNYTVCEEGIRIEVLRFRHLVAWQDIRRVKNYALYTVFMPEKLPRWLWWFGMLAGVHFVFYGFKPVFSVSSSFHSNFFRMRETLRIRVGEPARR
jgi:hypothetical protein